MKKQKLYWEGKHAISLNSKYDFMIDTDNKPIALLVFNNNIDDADKAFIEAIEVKSVKEAKEKAENYK